MGKTISGQADAKRATAAGPSATNATEKRRAATQRRASKSGNDAGGRPARLHVRPAGPSDFAPLTFFFDTVLRRDYFVRRGQLREILSGDRHRVFVAELDGVLAGVAILTRGARLVNTLIHPAYRGLGIGRAMIERSEAGQVRAKIDMSTGDPRGFYARLGFRSTGKFNGKGNIELLERADKSAAAAERAASAKAR